MKTIHAAPPVTSALRLRHHPFYSGNDGMSSFSLAQMLSITSVSNEKKMPDADTLRMVVSGDGFYRN